MKSYEEKVKKVYIAIDKVKKIPEIDASLLEATNKID